MCAKTEGGGGCGGGGGVTVDPIQVFLSYKGPARKLEQRNG
jgi:uncharacterized spore protein YtfJ